MEGADLRSVLSCGICMEVYKEPVTLLCGHNFCHSCIKEEFEKQREEYKCPECRKNFRRPVLTRNLTLKSIAEACTYSQQGQIDTGIFCAYCDLPINAVESCLQCGLSMCNTHVRRHNQKVQHTLLPVTMSLEERKCPTHNKILDCFCKTDSSCICASCFVAGDHKGHSVEPLEEAFQKKKEKLRNIQEELTSRREDTEEKLQTLQKSEAECQRKALQPMETILAFFIDIRKDLEDLEKKVIDEIYRQEERQSLLVIKLLQRLEMKNIQLSKKISYIQDLQDMADPAHVLREQESDREDFCHISEREEPDSDREKDDKELQGVNDLDVGPISEKLIALSDIITGISNGVYVQEAMDFSLNVNMAGQNVLVNEDGKTASWSLTPQNYPESPERFHCNQVLSYESVSSGQYYWDLETSDTGDWRIGVCYPSIDRKEHSSIIGNSKKSWCLHQCNNPISLPCDSPKYSRYLVIHDDVYTPLPHTVSCNRIRVSLDYKEGRLSFYELSDPMRHLHTFRATFSEPLHAAFYVWDKVKGKGSWVRIMGSGGQ
ncbi:E3 ubiquitin-protein ligase TRIM39-like [Dendropsophus ebraccatus]|uniref:E3 ubiquitin-protein ligase TRIM39-like n=1 Tax=Dendropsophus ebraccatus TaxID=150705 RepID=UPI003831223E